MRSTLENFQMKNHGKHSRYTLNSLTLVHSSFFLVSFTYLFMLCSVEAKSRRSIVTVRCVIFRVNSLIPIQFAFVCAANVCRECKLVENCIDTMCPWNICEWCSFYSIIISSVNPLENTQICTGTYVRKSPEDNGTTRAIAIHECRCTMHILHWNGTHDMDTRKTIHISIHNTGILFGLYCWPHSYALVHNSREKNPWKITMNPLVFTWRKCERPRQERGKIVKKFFTVKVFNTRFVSVVQCTHWTSARAFVCFCQLSHDFRCFFF